MTSSGPSAGAASPERDARPAPPGHDAARRRAAGVALLLVQLSRRVLEKRDADDLHAVQWSALRYFARAGRRSATVMGLATYLGNTTGSSSRTARSLVERGLVVAEPLREDARSVSHVLTAAGEAALAEDPLGEVAGALGTLDEAELSALASALGKVQAAIEEGRQ